MARFVLVLLAAGVVTPVGGREPDKAENKNTLIKAHRDKLKLSCSTFFEGWPVEKLIDGDKETSWFSASNDAAAQGTKPWVQIDFPVDVFVSRVTILGNREPNFPRGFSILEGKIEFIDAEGKVVFSEEGKGVGAEQDFEFKPKKAIAKVRSVRFTSLKDEGDKNDFKDIAIAEVLIE